MKSKIQEFIKKIFKFSNDPKVIAKSVALGVFWGILLPMGLQTLIIVPIAVFLRLNVYLAITATLITNPITIAPMYYLTINIGNIFMNYDLSWDQINKAIESPSMDNLYSLGTELFLTLALGNLLFASFACILAYAFVYYFAVWYNKRTKSFKKQL